MARSNENTQAEVDSKEVEGEIVRMVCETLKMSSGLRAVMRKHLAATRSSQREELVGDAANPRRQQQQPAGVDDGGQRESEEAGPGLGEEELLRLRPIANLILQVLDEELKKSLADAAFSYYKHYKYLCSNTLFEMVVERRPKVKVEEKDIRAAVDLGLCPDWMYHEKKSISDGQKARHMIYWVKDGETPAERLKVIIPEMLEVMKNNRTKYLKKDGPYEYITLKDFFVELKKEFGYDYTTCGTNQSEVTTVLKNRELCAEWTYSNEYLPQTASAMNIHYVGKYKSAQEALEVAVQEVLDAVEANRQTELQYGNYTTLTEFLLKLKAQKGFDIASNAKCGFRKVLEFIKGPRCPRWQCFEQLHSHNRLVNICLIGDDSFVTRLERDVVAALGEAKKDFSFKLHAKSFSQLLKKVAGYDYSAEAVSSAQLKGVMNRVINDKDRCLGWSYDQTSGDANYTVAGMDRPRSQRTGSATQRSKRGREDA